MGTGWAEFHNRNSPGYFNNTVMAGQANSSQEPQVADAPRAGMVLNQPTRTIEPSDK